MQTTTRDQGPRTSLLPKVHVLAVLMLTALAPWPASAQTSYTFYPIDPCRVYDSRPIWPFSQWPFYGQALPSSTVRTIPVRNFSVNQCGSAIPTTAVAVVLNITIVGPTAGGFLTLYPGNQQAPPTISNINFNQNEPALGNGAIVKLNPTPGMTDLAMIYGVGGGSASTNVILDATGYFQ